MQKVIKYMDSMTYWAVVLIPFSIAIAPGMTNTFMGFLFFGFLVKKALKREKLFISTPINFPFILLFAISVLSFLNSVDYTASFRGLQKLFLNAFLFLACAEAVKDKKHIQRIFLSVVLGAALTSFDAIWQVNFGKDFIRGNEPIINIGLTRATAGFPNANVFGIYLSAITPLIVGLAVYFFKGRQRFVMLFFAALATVGIALTFSRGTALGLYVAVLFMSIVKRSKFITAALIALLLISPFLLPKSIKEWAKYWHYNPVIFMCNSDRISIYRNTLNMIRHHPVVGVGVNTFSKNYLKYKLPEPADSQTSDSMYAHNHFLQMAGEIGLLGLAAFLWLLFRLFKKAMVTYNSLKDEYLRIVVLSVTACLLAFLVNGLTETSLYYSRVAMIFWYLIGLSLAISRFTHADKP